MTSSQESGVALPMGSQRILRPPIMKWTPLAGDFALRVEDPIAESRPAQCDLSREFHDGCALGQGQFHEIPPDHGTQRRVEIDAHHDQGISYMSRTRITSRF